MTITAAVLLLMAEAALLVLTLVKDRERLSWRKNRAAARGIEFILLLTVILLPFTHMKWRFTGALILTGILLLIAVLSWLIRRKKADTAVKRSKVINSMVLSVFMIGFALVPAFIFTNYNGLKTTGSYGVRESSAVLTDVSRTDPFEKDGALREVPVHFYYPDKEGTYPLVVFSHGAFGYYQSNYSTYAELVSSGYVVAALDHPHHAFFTKNSAGKTVIVDGGFIQDAIDVTNGDKSREEEFALYKEWMALRSADMDFVLDTIENAKAAGTLNSAWHAGNAEEILSVLSMADTEKIGVMGHSMGGATAVSAGRTRGDIDAVIVLDGTWLGEITGYENGACTYNEEAYPVPVLDFGKTSDYSEEAEADDRSAFALVNRYETGRAKDGKTVLFRDCEHMDFTDLPLFSPFLASMLGSDDIDHEAFMYRLNGLVRDWFDHYLKGKELPEIQAEY